MFAKKTCAAIDLGSHSVKYVEVETDTGRVRRAWRADLHPERRHAEDGLHGGDLRARVGALAQRLQAESGPAGRVVTALQGEGTWVQYLELPPLAPDEVSMAAQAVACKLIPFPLARVVLSTVSVPALRDGRSGVLLVAALRDPASEMSSMLGACGLTVHRMELVPLALAREFSRNHPDRANRFVGLINVGFSLTHVVVMRDGLPYYVREFRLGGRHFLHGLQKSGGFTWADTEQRFCAALQGSDGSACEPAVRAWMHEVNRTLVHFGDKIAGPSTPIREVWLSGGYSGWHGLRERVATHVALPVEVDGWQAIRWGATAESGQPGAWKAAVGMALDS